MTAKNMNQLNSMLIKHLCKAMNLASQEILADMYEETGKFYTQGKPKLYERTGALGDTPKTTTPTVSGNSVSFEAYLDKSHQYTTGKNPNMEDILNLANYGITNSSVGNLNPTLGKKGFWEESENKMQQRLDSTLAKFFRKL